MLIVTVTIRDVAKKALVSPSTVSRVIANNPNISLKTKNKVRKAMEELGFHPNRLARNLARRSTQTIGIVMKGSMKEFSYNPFFPQVIKGISECFHQEGYSISLTTGETEQEILEEVKTMVNGKAVDGMILLYSKKEDLVLPYLIEHDFPCVVIGKSLIQEGRVMYVDNNNVTASMDLTNYLIRSGHKNIAYIDESREFEVNNDRKQGYRIAMTAEKLENYINFYKFMENTNQEATHIVDEIISKVTVPTALIAANEETAARLNNTLRNKGYSVPDDFSIVCFNNSLISEISNPPITALETNVSQLGYESARCILDLLSNPTMLKKNIVVPTSIIERESIRKLEAQNV